MTDPINNNLKILITSKYTGYRLEEINYTDLKPVTMNGEIPSLLVDASKVRQKIMGFGGAFTEASASIYSKLDPDKKQEIIQSYFSDDGGNSYSFGRTHINSCDFSLGNYAYTETDGDVDLNHFSIEHDRSMLIPFIKDAMKEANEHLQIMASPWSPPAWMKSNGEMNNGGKLKKIYRKSWANYYCKFIEAYEQEGVPIWGVSVQNEPAAKQIWDSCLYTAEEERDFVRDFLGPAFHSNRLNDKKIVIWDHNRDEMVERARTVLSDPVAAKYVWGTGFHWYNGDHFDNVQKVHNEFPDKNLIFTEGCQEDGPHIGSWDLGEQYARSIINDLNRWTVAWLDWNLILDGQGGPNHVGNLCSAPIIVDNNEILYQSSYYYIGHFSRYIKRGDHILHSEINSDDLLTLSAVDTSGTIKTVVMNDNDACREFELVHNNSSSPISIPAHSILTIIIETPMNKESEQNDF